MSYRWLMDLGSEDVPVVPAPPVTNGNGTTVTNGAAITNGNGVVVQQEKKYFGFTAKQLMLMGAGGAVLYMLLKK